MDWQLAVVGPPMGQLLFGLIRTKPEARDQAAIEAARRRALAAWMIVDDEIKDRGPYLAGPELSLAEIVLGTQIYRWFTFPIERPTLDNLRAWYDRLHQRPGFKTHIETPIT
jgi:glutathione S-transferase